MKLGIMSGVYRHPLKEAARRVKADGFAGVQLDLTSPDVDFTTLGAEVGRRVADAFGEQGLTIAGISGYTNLLEPDEAKREAGIARLHDLLRHARDFGASIVVSQTGSRNPQSIWGWHPDNHGAEAWAQFRAALREAVKVAEDSGATIALECYVLNTVHNFDRAEELFNEMNSPALALLMDPCNFFDENNLSRMTSVLEEMFARLGDKISLAHAKDLKWENGRMALPRSGQGVLDYPTYLRLLNQREPDTFLIIEHLSEPEVAETREFVVGHVSAAGIKLE